MQTQNRLMPLSKSDNTASHVRLGKVGFDIDGVVADTMRAFIHIAREEYNIDTLHKGMITSYWLERCLPVPEEVVLRIVHQLVHEPLYVGLEPIQDAREALLAYAERSPLIFVTARPEQAPIHCWLQELLPELPEKRIQVIATGQHSAKALLLKDLGIETFIEDHLETCHQIHQAGIQAIVFNQPWNQGETPCRRLHSWQDFLQYL
ncbi:MAG: haloacid dehalogenase [Deltaproteobacteria bacterium]|nr:haloacid dehalogenase [Deltaproteobacteria bacterium]